MRAAYIGPSETTRRDRVSGHGLNIYVWRICDV